MPDILFIRLAYQSFRKLLILRRTTEMSSLATFWSSSLTLSLEYLDTSLSPLNHSSQHFSPKLSTKVISNKIS